MCVIITATGVLTGVLFKCFRFHKTRPTEIYVFVVTRRVKLKPKLKLESRNLKELHTYQLY